MFLISSYGTPLAQRASYLTQHSSLFEPDGTVNYDYIVTNSINSLLIGSQCIPNSTHTNHCRANLAHALKVIKNSDIHTYMYMYMYMSVIMQCCSGTCMYNIVMYIYMYVQYSHVHIHVCVHVYECNYAYISVVLF